MRFRRFHTQKQSDAAVPPPSTVSLSRAASLLGLALISSLAGSLSSPLSPSCSLASPFPAAEALSVPSARIPRPLRGPRARTPGAEKRPGSRTVLSAAGSDEEIAKRETDAEAMPDETSDGSSGAVLPTNPGVQSRRRMISTIAAGVLTSGVLTRHIKHAFAEYGYPGGYTNEYSSDASYAKARASAGVRSSPSLSSSSVSVASSLSTPLGTPEHPVAIVGGGGRTGMAVAEALADPAFGNMHAVTLSRSGKDPFAIVRLPETTRERLSHRSDPFDVREPGEAVEAGLAALKPSVVVYAASASRQGGNCFQVDDEGVEKVARACKNLGALFVLVSALAVDRPDSKSYKVTNTLGGNYQGIMDAKNHGEQATRAVFSSGGEYVIVRPGVLLNGKSIDGPAGIELNQGDTVGGGLSRDELAGVVVGAIQSRDRGNSSNKAGAGGVTVEAYRRSTAQALEKAFPVPSGNELSVDAGKVAATPASSRKSLYRELFANAKPDGFAG